MFPPLFSCSSLSYMGLFFPLGIDSSCQADALQRQLHHQDHKSTSMIALCKRFSTNQGKLINDTTGTTEGAKN